MAVREDSTNPVGVDFFHEDVSWSTFALLVTDGYQTIET